MDGWLKALIAAACVVVIAGGGYSAWMLNSDAKAVIAADKEAAMRAGCAKAEALKGAMPAMHERCKELGY